jgi:hypothetical protein
VWRVLRLRALRRFAQNDKFFPNAVNDKLFANARRLDS